MRRTALLLAALLVPLALPAPAGAALPPLPPEVGAVDLAGPGWVAFRLQPAGTPIADAPVWVSLESEGGAGFHAAGLAILDGQKRLVGAAAGILTGRVPGERLAVGPVAVLDATRPVGFGDQAWAFGLSCGTCLARDAYAVLYGVGSFDRMRVALHAPNVTAVASERGTGGFGWTERDLGGLDARAPGTNVDASLQAGGARLVTAQHGLYGFYLPRWQDRHAAFVASPAGLATCDCWLGGRAHPAGTYAFHLAAASTDERATAWLAGVDARLPA